MRLAISINKEEYETIKQAAGIAPMSAYIRSRVFSKESETQRNGALQEWVDALSQIDVELLNKIMNSIKVRSSEGGKPVHEIIKLRLDR